jgi:protein SCO1/2
MSRRNLTLIAVCLLGLALLAGVAWRSGLFAAPPAPTVGGPFRLVDQTGKPVDEKVLKGKWSAVFFGFTYCPDVCPTTLQVLAQAKDRLGPRGKDLQIVFISVDPGRDTPEQLARYLSGDGVPPGTLGLTGTPEQVAAVAKAYKVFYEKSGTGSDYLVNHSSLTYLMDPKGRFNRVLPWGIGPDEVATQVANAMRG